MVTLSIAGSSRSFSRVPSVERSSTMITSFLTGEARTARSRSSRCAISLYTGTITDTHPCQRSLAAGSLPPCERARALRFFFARDGKNFTATRALLRILLGTYIGCRPEKVALIYGDKEKPSLDATLGAEHLQFNISHSGSRALLAFAR